MPLPVAGTYRYFPAEPHRLPGFCPKVSSPMSAADRNPAVSKIAKAMIEKKITQAELADAADCHEKTVQNLMNGRPVRDQTLFDVCMVLGLDFEDIKHAWNAAGGVQVNERHDPGRPGVGADVAPLYMGAYNRLAVDHYVGSYLTLRPAFTIPDMIIAYRTEITWDAGWPSLLFEEQNRPDAPYSHRGRLYVPASSMYIHLVSLTKGAMRMIVVSQLDQNGDMRGIITTLNKARAQIVPVASPIVYAKTAEFAADAFGEITPKHPSYGAYRQSLRETLDQGYARLIAP
jgi:DNA-binding Xre family transcriptional regulator